MSFKRSPRTVSGNRLTAALSGLLLALAALVASAPEARAQWGDAYESPGSNPFGAPPPRRRYRESSDDERAYSRPRRYAPPQQEAPRQFTWPWEDRGQQTQPSPQQAPGYERPGRPRYADEYRRRPTRTRPTAPTDSQQARKRQPRPAPVPSEEPAVAAKATPNTQVAVFGDTLATYLGKGLDKAFEDNPDVAILDRSRGDSGIVRKDVVDWPKTADEFLKGNPKVAYALFMLGANDRQPIIEGDQSYEPLSDKWRETYVARVDGLLKVFVDRKIPLVWVNLPPMRSEGYSRDLSAINEIVRERVQKAGQTYVDIWPGFVDERNRYTPNGPDLDGQEAKLRTSDGIHFTTAGARKLAHFADVELKRLMGGAAPAPIDQPAVATTPSGVNPGEGTGASLDDTSVIDRRITAMLPSLPEPPGIPTLPVKPAAGPVVPLGRGELSPGGVLTSGRPREGDATGTIERSLQRGVAPMPQPGRADDFKWPPG